MRRGGGRHISISPAKEKLEERGGTNPFKRKKKTALRPRKRGA